VKVRLTLRAVALVSAILPALNATGAPRVPLRPAPDTSLTPVHHPASQVSGCELIGKAFGTVSAGGEIIFKGEKFEVTESHGRPDRIVYSGPKVRAVFTPKRGHKVSEGENGAPDGTGPDAPGTVRIEIAEFVITTFRGFLRLKDLEGRYTEPSIPALPMADE
jgi:hypothetical protein